MDVFDDMRDFLINCSCLMVAVVMMVFFFPLFAIIAIIVITAALYRHYRGKNDTL